MDQQWSLSSVLRGGVASLQAHAGRATVGQQSFTGGLRQSIAGIALATLTFLALALGLFLLSLGADTALVTAKIRNAFATNAIPIEDIRHYRDPRGLDPWADCLAMQMAITQDGDILKDAFSAYTYTERAFALSGNEADETTGKCLLLSRYVAGQPLGDDFVRINYNRYWWGSGTLFRTLAGLTPLSVAGYRNLIHALCFAGLGLILIAFVRRYGVRSLLAAPLLLSILLGFSMMSMGRSISQAPSTMAGFIMIGIISLRGVNQWQPAARAYWYGLAGAVTVYFCLLNGGLALIALLVCIESAMPFVMAAWDRRAPSEESRDGWAPLKAVIANLSYFMIGGASAVAARVIGYALVSGAPLLDAVRDWSAKLVFRIDGTATPGTGTELPWPERMLLLAQRLNDVRQKPFDLFALPRLADLFYVSGALAWAAGLILFWRLHRRGGSGLGLPAAFLMAGAIVPAWFLLMLQHSLVHAWMTARLLAPFAGVGLMLCLIAVTLTLRDNKWSGREDSNLRPLPPEDSALPG